MGKFEAVSELEQVTEKFLPKGWLDKIVELFNELNVELCRLIHERNYEGAEDLMRVEMSIGQSLYVDGLAPMVFLSKDAQSTMDTMLEILRTSAMKELKKVIDSDPFPKPGSEYEH